MAFRMGRAAIGAALAAALCVAGLACSRDDASAGGTGTAKARQGTKGKGVEFTHETAFQRIRIEAEAANAIESDDALPAVGGKVMRVADDPGAAGGKCVWIPDKAGTPEPDPKSGVPPKFARAVYKFKIAVPGNYTFWVRRKWQDSCGDTLYVRFNKEGARHTDAFICGSDDSSEVPKWGWSPVWEEGQPRQFFLAAGEHVLEILNREDGPRFDVILLTDDPGYLPQGMEE
mgnify:CR=1 FL=1